MTLDGRLLLVAALEDAGLAREFAQRIGGDLERARTSYGEREFVEGASPARIEDGTLLIEGGAGDDRVEIEPDGDRDSRSSSTTRRSRRGWTRSSASAPISAAAPTPSSVGDLTDAFVEEVRLDLGAGDGRADRVAVAGSRDDDQTSVLAFGGSVAVLGPTFVAIDGAEPGDRLTVGGGDGDDILSASTAAMRMTLDGGDGSDVLLGGPGDDLLIGGDDFDDVKGGRGDDVADLGGDFDRFSWAPGDGSDSVDGGGEPRLAVLPRQRRRRGVRGDRRPAAACASPATSGASSWTSRTSRRSTRSAGRGADTFAVGDLSRTPVQLVDVSLSPGFGFPAGDGQADRVTVQGTDRADRMTLTGRVVVGGTATLTGLPATVNVSHAEGALDALAIDTRGGDDTLDTLGLRPGDDRARGRVKPSDHAALVRRGGGLPPRAHAELAEHRGDVVIDGADGDRQPVGDLGVGHALAHEPEHGELAVRQARGVRPRRRPRAPRDARAHRPQALARPRRRRRRRRARRGCAGPRRSAPARPTRRARAPARTGRRPPPSRRPPRASRRAGPPPTAQGSRRTARRAGRRARGSAGARPGTARRRDARCAAAARRPRAGPPPARRPATPTPPDASPA